MSQLPTLIPQKPDAAVQRLATVTVTGPWLKKARNAGIPVRSVATQS